MADSGSANSSIAGLLDGETLGVDEQKDLEAPPLIPSWERRFSAASMRLSYKFLPLRRMLAGFFGGQSYVSTIRDLDPVCSLSARLGGAG